MPHWEPPTFVDGEEWNAEKANKYVRDNWAQATRQIGVHVRRTTSLAVSNNYNDISWEAEVTDTDGFWTGGLPTLFQVPAGFAGLYVAMLYIDWNGTPTNPNYLTIKKNGLAVAKVTTPAVANAANNCTVPVWMNQGDQLTAAIYNGAAHTIGVHATPSASLPYAPAFQMWKVQ